MKMLFQSFLTSISTCINFKDVGRVKVETDDDSERKSIKLDLSDSPKNHQQVKMGRDDENKENNNLSKNLKKLSLNNPF